MEILEGRVRLTVPGTSEEAIEEDVFYNPNQVLNRDLTVAVLRAYREREPRAERYLDAMAASGVRGLRAAADGWTVTLCDRDEEAVTACRANLAQNDLEGEVVQADANAHIHASPYDVIDIDPYGSPIRFADSALASARDLVCFTATDTAPLCGAHFAAGKRRYDAVPRNTEYHPEMGLRILLGALVRTAARYDRAATPLFSHSSRHYVRTYLELDGGAQVADTALEHLGFLYHCQDCLYRESETGRIPRPPDDCPNCGTSAPLVAGPLWLGPIRDPAFAGAVADAVSEEMDQAEQARSLAVTVADELDRPTHYDHHRLCKAWGRPASAMDTLLTALRDAGYNASRAHYSGTAFKTDASVAEIREATADD